MKKHPCFIIFTPGFAEHEQETTVLPFSQSFVLSFSKCFPEIKLIVVAFQFPHKPSTYQWNGVEVIALAGSHKRLPKRFFTWLKALKTVRSIKKQYAVKGIFSFWLSECGLAGQYAQKLLGVKQYSWLIGQDAKPDNKVLKYLKLNQETVVSMSPNLVQQLNKHRPVTGIKVIPLGINQNYFDSIKASEIGYDILGVGSLIELKNYRLFIELLSMLKDEFPNINTAIIGGGPQQEELEQLIVQYGLQNNVQLKGLMQHEEVVTCMKSSNVFLHTSSYEGQATVFVEALYCGMKVVCFDVGRLHSDENMFVCKDKEAMLQALKQQLIAKQERKQILVQSMDDTVRQVMALYD